MPRRKNKKLKQKRTHKRFERLESALANHTRQQETEEERERRERETEQRDKEIDEALSRKGLCRHRVPKDGACLVGEERGREGEREGERERRERERERED